MWTVDDVGPFRVTSFLSLTGPHPHRSTATLFTSPVHFSSPGGLVPRAGKKGECWTFLDWRLNSENDSPVHGQPSSRLLGLVSPSVLALRLSPSLITIPGGAGPVRERTGPFGRHDDGGRERPKGPESEGNREPHEIENNWPKDRMFTRVVRPSLTSLPSPSSAEGLRRVPLTPLTTRLRRTKRDERRE